MPINPQINDMPWFGKPADPVGAYQQGQNLAEQSQRMSQSRDMHPLKMADLKSATSARDANTNLSKQSYQFNELSQDDRLSSVNSLARRNAVFANVAEQTQQAQVNMQNIQALEKGRDWDVRKAGSIATETKAEEARLQRVIVDQAKNAATANSYVERYKAESKGIEHRTSLLGLQTDLATRTNELRFNAVSAQLVQQAGDADRANQKHQEWLQKLPYYQAHVSRIEEASARGDITALRSMTFEGASTEQTAQLKALVAQRLDNDAGKNAEAAFGAHQTAMKSSLADSFNLTDDQQEALENSGGIDPNTKALTTTGRKLVNRMKAQNDLLDGIPPEIQDRLIMQATETNDPVALFSEAERHPYDVGPSQGQSLAGKNAAIYGTKHGGEFVLNKRGMSRLGPLVSKYKAELANARFQSKATQATALGVQADTVEIGSDGKISATFKSRAMTDDQAAKNVQAAFDAKIKAATDAGKEVTPQMRQQYINEARQDVFASTLQRAANAAQARSMGLKRGVPYWNQSALNADKTRGGVRQAGQEGEDGTLDVRGRPAGAGAATGGKGGGYIGGTPEWGNTSDTEFGAPNKAYQESSADDEFEGVQPLPPIPSGPYAGPNAPDPLDKILEEERAKSAKGEVRKVIPRKAKDIPLAKPTTKEATPKAERLPNRYDTGPLRDLGISATDPSMDDITLRSARQSLRLGRPLSREEANALVNKHPIPKDMPAENIRVINAARRGEKLPPQDKEWLKEMNINPETGIPMGKVKIVRLPPRPTPRPKKSPPQARKNPAMETTKNISKDIKKNLEAIREKSDMNDKIIRDWENGRISSEEMRKRLGIK